MEYGAERRRHTMMLVADGQAATARGAATAHAAGLDLKGVATITAAAVAADIAVADLLFIDAEGDENPAYESLLDRVAEHAGAGGAAVVAISPELIDRTMSRIGGTGIDILCNAGDAHRIVAVHMALARQPGMVREGRDDPGDRLRVIGDELERLARQLIGLAEGGLRTVATPPLPAMDGTGTPVLAEDFRRIIRGRRIRDQYLGADLFADPAWDMLLDLAAARIEGRAVAVSSLCIAAAVPPTTALRWIRALTERGVLMRRPDPEDGRRIFMALSDATADAMENYVRAVRKDA